MTPKELEKRCSKLFGAGWRGELAFNLGCTRQNIDSIMHGKHRITPAAVKLIEVWESGRLKIKHRNLGKAGRPFKKAARS